MAFVQTRLLRGFSEIAALQSIIEGYGVICGGYARYCASPRTTPAPTSDVDVYAYTVSDFERLKYTIGKYNRKARENPVSIVYEREIEGPLAYVPEINLIKPMIKGRAVTVGSIVDVLGNFDFTIARAAIASPHGCLVDEDFHEDELAMRLRLKNIHCPISSTLRCAKYVAKGYHLRPYDALDLFLDWDGRDTAYREEIIGGLREMETAIRKDEMLAQDRITAIYELLTVD